MGSTYDFSGWATKNDLLCSDGRTIRKDAFKHNDGDVVPLVWNHNHGGSENVLGHALLENRDKGVYTYGYFNDTIEGQRAKELVKHGDIKSLSIYANHLKQHGGDVIHGAIKEVSLVLAGANPGATIDTVLVHGDDSGEEATISFVSRSKDTDLVIMHAEEAPKEEENKKMANSSEKTVQDVFDELTDEQKNVVYAIIGQALEDAGVNPDNESDEEDETMKHNAFDGDDMAYQGDVLSHAETETIFNDAKRYGSLRDSFLAHASEYGIDSIDWLFPEARNLTETPGFIKRTPDAWVNVVMSGVHHTPFSKVKMMFADLREDEARAKGYLKGKFKKEEVFGLLKRVVTATTIYKKQKLDRDDIIEVTDFDVVSWLKGEMRMMLDEEIARAILFGDGRSTLSEDKVDETKIIPIVSDSDFYAIKTTVTPETDETQQHAFVTAAVTAQDDYEGSGNTTLFVANKMVTKLLLMEDTQGHRLYKDLNELALALNVNKITKVPASIVPDGVLGVIVDLNDYNIGADKGGSINMFDDFDIDYNQEKYLIETRCSGALTKPYSAIVLKEA